ncbi:CoA pyrophosphatase [Lacinutrix sp. Hel_I_90]|uniref:NUDIX hydrolase n=1 Tax=Lacinutrix sp. Hel_I_90 TaxID=1249999 RepID=UPI0005C98F36|nr:CoA pyrophosphatase [Lacinutrix sp. Hel_I_90]
MKFDAFSKAIKGIKNLQLPGQASQFKMSPPYREHLVKLQADKIKNARQAAVMALFYPDLNNETHIILILRKTYKGVHSAQIGFPGGKLEAGETKEEAAIRETEEEVGVKQEDMTVLKQLTQIYIPPSNFYVQPFIGVCQSTPIFTKQDDEVEDLLEVHLNDFLNESHVITKTVSTAYDVSVDVPAFKLNGHSVWGATAMILSEVKDLLNTALK